MATVTLTFTALPAQVRTARMLAVALGRRSGLPDELLDEVRLAVGEVCSRAIAVQARTGSKNPVAVTFTEDGRGFAVEVTDDGDAADVVAADLDDLDDLDATGDSAGADSGDVAQALPPGIGLAVVRGLVDDVQVTKAATGGTVVSLRWER